MYNHFSLLYTSITIHARRNSLKARPPPMKKDDPYYAGNDRRYEDLSEDQIPLTESLMDCMERGTICGCICTSFVGRTNRLLFSHVSKLCVVHCVTHSFPSFGSRLIHDSSSFMGVWNKERNWKRQHGPCRGEFKHLFIAMHEVMYACISMLIYLLILLYANLCLQLTLGTHEYIAGSHASDWWWVQSSQSDYDEGNVRLSNVLTRVYYSMLYTKTLERTTLRKYPCPEASRLCTRYESALIYIGLNISAFSW